MFLLQGMVSTHEGHQHASNAPSRTPDDCRRHAVGHAHHGFGQRYLPSCDASPICPLRGSDRYRVDTGWYGLASRPKSPGNPVETPIPALVTHVTLLTMWPRVRPRRNRAAAPEGVP